MSAREIIATTAVEGRREPIGHLHATAIISMLTAAGYRILAPGELDPETVERCANVAEKHPPLIDVQGSLRLSNQADIATAIRSLTRPQP